MPANRPRVLLADDHQLMAAGIRELLDSRYQIVGIVGDGEALLEAALTRRPDVILADISMPGLDDYPGVR